MLHGDRLTGPQERPIGHRVRPCGAFRTPGDGHVETPRLDATTPTAEHEGHVLRLTRLIKPRRDEEPRLGNALATPSICIEVGAIDACKSSRVGPPSPQGLAPTVIHRHLRRFDRTTSIERGHPDKAIVFSQLEVQTEIGDQGSGPDEHRLNGVEQRLSELRRLQLEHVIARLRQRNADHVDRLVRIRWRYRHRLQIRRALQPFGLAVFPFVLLVQPTVPTKDVNVVADALDA